MSALTLVGVAVAHSLDTAPKFWPKYSGNRKVTLLDGASWEYGLHFDIADSVGVDPSKLANLTPNKTAVPSCIDAVAPGYAGPRGVAFYRTTFSQAADTPARLWFGACSFYCRVFVDGVQVGEHRAGGYVAFHVDVPPPSSSDADRELLVLADNRFNSTTAPLHTGGDFWHYGGLMRSVALHELRPKTSVTLPWVWRAYALPSDAALDAVNVTLVLDDAKFHGRYSFHLGFDDNAPAWLEGKANNGIVQLSRVKVPSPRVWKGVSDPQLHTLNVSVGGGTVMERFALRWWDTDASGRLTLNGDVIKLHGWNHHTQWPDTGAAPTDAQLDADLALLLKAGTNYVRGAHYPQDQRWLDRLDASGIAMWEETLGPRAIRAQFGRDSAQFF